MALRGVKSLCLGISLVVSISGCSGIVNPHISWNENVGQGTSSVTLDQAITYADRAKTAYKEALGNQAQLASWLGIGIIPLMSAAAGLGINGASTAAVSGTTLAGVASYGVGTWLYSKPYQRAWVAGYNATSCAVSAVIPLRDVDNRKKDIQARVNTLDDKRDAVVTKSIALVNAIQAATKLSSTSDLMLQAKQRVQDADALVAATAATRSNALKMLGQAEMAGPMLKEAVDRIGGQVSALLVEAGPDLQALASIIGGLASTYQNFVAAPQALKPPAKVLSAQGAPDENQAKAITNATVELDNAMRELVTANQKVADDIDRLAGTTPIETLRSCGVSSDQISAPLSLDPPGPITFDAGKTATEGRVVKGGAAPFAVVLQGTLTDLSVKQTEPFGSSFVVQTSDKTPAGKVTVFVTDRSGNKLFVPVTVNPAGSGGASDQKTNTGAQTPLVAALKNLKDKLDATPNVSLPQNQSALVTNANVNELAQSLSLDVTLKDKDGKDLSAPEAAKVTTETILTAIAKLGNGVSSKNIIIVTKQGVVQAAKTK